MILDVVLGVVLCLAVECLFVVFLTRRRNSREEDRPEDSIQIPHKTVFAQQIKSYLQQVLTPSSSPIAPPQWGFVQPIQNYSKTEQITAINVLFARYWVELSSSHLFKSKLKQKFKEKINSKLIGNSFVESVSVKEINLASNVPIFNGIRIINGITKDLAVQFEIDLNYKGGVYIIIETILTTGTTLPVKVTLAELNGKLRGRIPSPSFPDMLSIAFAEDPGAVFVVDSSITVGSSVIIREGVNKLLSRVVKKIFLDLWVLPNWRNFFMPLMDASFVVDEKTRDTTKKLDKQPQTIFPDRVSSLWEYRPTPTKLKTALFGAPTATSHHPQELQIGSDIESFSCTAPPTDINEMDANLCTAFLKLANEDDELWRVIKSKGEVGCRRKRVGGVDLGSVKIDCGFDRVVSVLTNVKHLGHVDEGYAGSTILKQYDEFRSVRQTFYHFSKSVSKEYTVFEVKRSLQVDGKSFVNQTSSTTEGEEEKEEEGEEEGTNEEGTHEVSKKFKSFIVVCRSIGNIEKNDETEINQQPSTLSKDNDTSPTPTPIQSSSSTKESTTISTPPPPENPHQRSTSESAVLLTTTTTIDPYSSKRRETITTLITTPPDLPPLLQNKVFIYGYLIQSTPTPTQTLVTIISHLTPDLARLEVSFQNTKKIKDFIEELDLLTRASVPISEQPVGIEGFSSEVRASVKDDVVVGAGQRIDKLKQGVSNVVAGASNVAGLLWKGKQSAVGEPSVVPGSGVEPVQSSLSRTIAKAVSGIRSRGEAAARISVESLEVGSDDRGSVKSASSVKSEGVVVCQPLDDNSPGIGRRDGFIESEVLSRETKRFELDYKTSPTKSTNLKWDFICLNRQSIQFSITFTPTTIKQTITKLDLLPINETGEMVIIPLVSINASPTASTKGYIDVGRGLFPDGVFTVLFLNNTQVLKKVLCKIELVDLDDDDEEKDLVCFGMDVSVARKMTLKIPVFVDLEIIKQNHNRKTSTADTDDDGIDDHNKKDTLNEINNDRPVLLEYDYSTGGYEIQFGVSVCAFGITRNVRGSIDKLNGVDEKEKVEKELLPLMKSNSARGLVKGTVPLVYSGVYCLLFDNSLSSLVNKHCFIRVSIKR